MPRWIRLFVAALALAYLLPSSGAELQYLESAQPDLTTLLAPPPAPDSASQQRDLQAVLAIQASRSTTELAQADADSHKTVFRFADVLGPHFDAASLPITAAFFKRLSEQGAQPMKQAKAYWKRPRPYNVSALVHPGIETEGKSPSYPSGHATFAYLCAVVLANMVPEQRAAIFARAEVFAQGRVIGGVHYPTDVEAGKLSGTLIAAAMLQNPAFRSDLQQATQETRDALGLPPLK